MLTPTALPTPVLRGRHVFALRPACGPATPPAQFNARRTPDLLARRAHDCCHGPSGPGPKPPNHASPEGRTKPARRSVASQRSCAPTAPHRQSGDRECAALQRGLRSQARATELEAPDNLGPLYWTALGPRGLLCVLLHQFECGVLILSVPVNPMSFHESKKLYSSTCHRMNELRLVDTDRLPPNCELDTVANRCHQ